MHPQSDSPGQWRAEAEVRALARALALVQALVQAQAQAAARALVQAQAEAQAQAEVQVQAEPQTLAQALAQAVAVALARTQAQALAQAQAQMQVQARAKAEAQALALALTQARAHAHVRAGAADVQAQAEAEAHTVTYSEVLADSELMKTIDSLKTNYRHNLARDLWPSYHKYGWFIQIITPIIRLPPELLQQILLIIIDTPSHSPLVLMRVSKLWYTIVTGIWASVELGTTTPKNAIVRKLERNQWLLDVLVDTEIDRDYFTPSESAYQAIFAAIEATSRWRSFVVETFPGQTDLAEHLVNHGLQRCSNPVMSRLRTFRIKCPCEMSPLLERLLRIFGTTASEELATVEINSPSVMSFLAPTYTSIFHSVKVLSLDTPGLPNPVDILPHLRQMQVLTASHLSFPNYHNNVNLPLVHTLRHLTLRAVSIQWMSGRTFHVLESCTILFPLHCHVLHTFSTTLPSCNDLTFHGYPLEILHGVSAHNLTHLSVMSSCSYKPRGSQQLVRFSSQALRESRLAPQILHISIEAMSWAWTKAFTFMSSLEELVIDNAQPSSLGMKVLRSFVVHPAHASSLGTATTHGGQNIPVCPSLKRFGLRYRRWLRPSEQFDLIPEFVSIIWSRQQSKFPLQSFRIWKGSDQVDPLELIEGSWISAKGFERLSNDGAIKGEDILQLVARRLVENLFKPCPQPRALKCN